MRNTPSDTSEDRVHDELSSTSIPGHRAVTENQRRFLLADELTEANYGLPLVYRADGPMDVAAFRAAFEGLIAKHSALRSRFVKTEAGYAFEVRDQIEGWWTELDLVGLSRGEALSSVSVALSGEFGLWDGPLVRCVVGRADDMSHLIGISVHHSISDGVSLANLIEQIPAAYANSLRGAEPAATSVDEYYYKSQGLWSGEVVARDEEYWKNYLASAPSSSGVPLDFLRPSAQNFAKHSIDRTLPPELFAAVDGLAKSSKTSTFSVFASVLPMLLGRYGGTDDVCLGFQSSGRQGRADLRDAVGLFSTPLILRARPRSDRLFGDYLQAVRSDIVAALKHQRCPYDRLLNVAEGRPSVDLNFYPPTPALELERLTVVPESGPEWESDFDINFYCHPTPDGLLMRLHYDASLFSEERMAIVLAQFEDLLRQVTLDPDQELGDIAVCLEPSREAIPDARMPLEPISLEPIFAEFCEQAKRTPDAVAIEGESSRWTYGELDTVSNRLANRLISESVGPGATVAVFADRDPAIVHALLGVLKSGAAFVVIDAAYPAERVADYLDQLKPTCVLGRDSSESEPVRERATSGGCAFIEICSFPDAAAKSLEPFDESMPSAVIDGTSVAYYSFTSGSTGKAKCIQTGHAPLVHFVAWHRSEFGFTAEDRFSMLSGLSHDPLLRDIFTPLSIGARVCIPSAETLLDPPSLFEWFVRHEVSACHLTPQMGQLIAMGAERASRLPRLEHVFWGGDTLTVAAIEPFRAFAPNAEHINFYGATETPQAMAWRRIDPRNDDAVVPIGAGIDGVQVLVLTPEGRMAAVGELGEICIRTRYLSGGYPFDEAQSRTRFVANPFNDDPTDLIYHTGDFGRFGPDGAVVFAGRVDDQVKVRGFRVELDEVSACIERHPDVATAMVRLHEGSAGAPRLVAYYSVSDGVSLARADVSEFVRRHLPEYMLPAFFVPIDRWPLMLNGKIDRKALPAPGGDDAPVAAAYEEPQTPREKELAEIWQSVLGIPSVGVNESLFSLGGDSLTAIRITYRMARLGIDKRTCRAIFQGWTIREIAQGGRDESDATMNTGDAHGKPASASDEATLTLLVNVVRGILVGLIVVGHWMPGLLQRLPSSFGFLKPALTPLFNLSTPGFVYVFGISVGFVYYPMYKQNRARTVRLLINGTLLLLAAVVLLAVMRLASHVVEGETVTSTMFFNSFYSVITYYLLAVATVPLWLRVISAGRRPIVGAIALSAFMWIAYSALMHNLSGKEFSGFVQWCKLMSVAKFSYFNMSVGACAGVALGVYLHQNSSGRRVHRLALAVGLPLLVGGVVAGLATGGREQWLQASRQILLWKWVMYGGVVVLMLSVLYRLIANVESMGIVPRWLVRVVGVGGQCALPMFLLHHITISVKHLLEGLGMPDVLALGSALGLFVLITAALMRRVYNLYYGSLNV